MLNNKKYEIEVDECSVAITGVSEAAAPVVSAPAAAPAPAPAAPAPAAAPAAPAAPTASASGTSVVSPMPGSILSVNVSNGQTVRAGEVLFILEAMKMENDIVAPCDGIVKQVLVTKGTTVETDQVLAVI